ncbi:MAG: extracellular solute-binding protein [Treponema sp.]|jgi:raffinose/stachyose/melibiose transport system substrate-binding protein|nr:extracellular solute-binding protein [Treponema sp.]
MIMKQLSRAIILGTVLFVALALSAYAGPGRDGNASGKKTISFWKVISPPAYDDNIKANITRFEKDNPDFAVEQTYLQNEDYKAKIVIALGSNTAPDIFTTWTGGGMIEYVKSNLIIPLTKYMNTPYQSLPAYKDYFMEGGINQATYQNDVWATPGLNASVLFVWYSKKIYDRLGLKIPATLAELEANCDKIRAAGIVPFGLANKAKYHASFYYMLLVDRYGGPQVFQNAANRMNGGTFNDPAFTWASRKMQEWARKGYFPEGYNSLDGEADVHRRMFYNQEAAMLIEGSWTVANLMSDGQNINDYGLFPFPVVEGGRGTINGMVGTIGDSFYCINSGAKYPDESFKLIQYLVDEAAIKGFVSGGGTPPTKNASAGDPLSEDVLKYLKASTSTQLWYDQYLPSAMAEVHKDSLQSMVGLTITPEQYNQAMEEAAQRYLK